MSQMVDGTLLEAISSSEERIRQDIHALKYTLNKALLNDVLFDSDRDPVSQYLNPAPSLVGTAAGPHSPTGGDHGPLESLRHDSDASKLERASRNPSDSTVVNRAAFAKRTAMSSSFLSTAYPVNLGELPATRWNSAQASLQTAKSASGGRHWRGWPANIQLLPDYAMDEPADQVVNLKSIAETAADRAMKIAGPVGILEAATPQRILGMIRPDSERRLAFDCMCMLVLMFDIIYTPYSLTWEQVVPDNVAIGVLCCTATFWIADMGLSFCTGYHTDEGKVEMGPSQVARRYLRTWFAPDFLCILADATNIIPIIFWGTSSSGNPAAVSRIIRLTKLARCLRVVGMVRMLRVISTVNVFMEAQLTEAWRMMVRILQLTATLLWLGHLCACGWYAVGVGAPRGEVGETWLQTLIGLNEENFKVFSDLSPGYQYVASYHWGLAQLTLGAHDINPVNAAERIFTICCNLFGLLFGGTLISILSTTLIDLREINQERSNKMRLLKEFLLQHQVDMGVRIRIIRQVQERMKKRDHTLVEKDVAALQAVSLTLLRELRFALFSNGLVSHSVFRTWTSLDADSVKHLSADGVEFRALLADDELFSSGKAAQAAYYVSSGAGGYKLESQVVALASDVAASASVPDEEVAAGAWLCEATWWCSWFHVGTLTTKVPCTFIAVPPKAVLEALQGSVGSIHAITSEYARLFHQQVVQASGGSYTPTDLHVHYAQFSNLIFHMSADVHVILGMAALEQVISSRSHWQLKTRSHLAKMEEEIRHGQSVVLLDKDGSLQRQVALTLLRIEREASDEEVLTQVALYDETDHAWRPSCRVPGMKQQFAETPGQALERFLQARMSCCANFIAMNSGWAFTNRQEVQHSATFCMGTTYNKSIFMLPCTEAMLACLSRFSVATPGLMPYSSRAKSDRTLGSRGNFASMQDLGRHLSRMPTATKVNEELSNKLEAIKEVYVLHGSESAAIYAWMDDETREELSTHDDLFRTWVGRLEQGLPDGPGWPSSVTGFSASETASQTSSI